MFGYIPNIFYPTINLFFVIVLCNENVDNGNVTYIYMDGKSCSVTDSE